MKYVKPEFYVAEFELNETIAANCTSTVTGTQTTTTYPAQTVICEIGGQQEVVFNSGVTGCSTMASKYALGWYEGVYYFAWYSPNEVSGGKPDDAQKTLMASISGVSDPQGWHYCPVASEDISTDILGFSY